MSIVVTGIGAITPAGVGRQAWQAGETATRLPPDLDLKALLGGKGLRSVDRLGQLALAACQDALADAGLGAGLDPARTGVALGTAFGGLASITGFFQERLQDGPRLVTASNFGNIVMNAAASQVALRHGFTALNATFTSGSASGLDAIGWALDFLRAGRADVVLAGGADELSPEALATLDALGWAEHGWVPAEGAVVWVLEHEEAARARGARILARVASHAATFDPGAVLGQRRAPAGHDMLGAQGPLAGMVAMARLQDRTTVQVSSPSGHAATLVLEAAS
jgi:3-oxoacyl-[acyl-carrier-protein] synthase II